MIVASRLAKIAARSTLIKRTSTGPVASIRVIMAVRCGGAAARSAKISPVASSASTSPRMMRMRK